MGCVVYECMEVIFYGLMDPLDHPHPSLQRPAAGRGASLCLPFVMRCHLALLAVRGLFSSPCDTHHEYDHTVSAFSLLIGGMQTPPVHILMPSGLQLALCCAEPLLFFRESIHINEAGLSVFPTSACGIVELWSRREGCRPDSSSRRRRRRLQPCQFAVSWTVCENQPWPCR